MIRICDMNMEIENWIKRVYGFSELFFAWVDGKYGSVLEKENIDWFLKNVQEFCIPLMFVPVYPMVDGGISCEWDFPNNENKFVYSLEFDIINKSCYVLISDYSFSYHEDRHTVLEKTLDLTNDAHWGIILQLLDIPIRDRVDTQ